MGQVYKAMEGNNLTYMNTYEQCKKNVDEVTALCYSFKMA